MNKFANIGILFLSLFCSGNAKADILSATYIVPAAKDGTPSTSYPLINISFAKTDAGLQTLTFSLPEDLVGTGAAPVILNETPSSTPGILQLTGIGISALCSAKAKTNKMDCTLSYTPGYLSVDPKTAADFLNKKYSDNSSTLSEKLITSAHFIHDPEGVVEFSLPLAQ